MKHKIKIVQGYQLVYDDEGKAFKLLNSEGEELVHGPSQEGMETKAEELKKLSFKFPIKALYNYSPLLLLGRVTSLNITDHSVRFVPDNTSGYGQSKCKVGLSNSRLFDNTKANRLIYQEVSAKRELIQDLEKEIDDLKKKLESPIGFEYFGLEPGRRLG